MEKLAKNKDELKNGTKARKKGKELEATYVEKVSTKRGKASTKVSTNKVQVNKKNKDDEKKLTEKRRKKSSVSNIEIGSDDNQDLSRYDTNIQLNSSSESEETEGSVAKKYQKAYCFPRFLAYIIDFMVITFLTSLVLMVVPKNENYAVYLKEYQKVQADFIELKISPEQYMNKTADIIYDIDYSNVIPMIIEVVVLILYYIVFQFYNKGQTLGKKLMKVRVVSDDYGEVSMNQYILRSFIIPTIVSQMLIIAMVLFIGRDIYYYGSFTVQGVQIVLIIISIFMALYSKSGRGLHDRLAKTRVIMVD